MSRLFCSLKAAFRFLFFTWLTPMVAYGRHHTLQIEDMPEIPDSIRPDHVVEGFHHLPSSSAWKFLFGVAKALRPSAIKMLCLSFAMVVLQVSGPILLRALLNGITQAVSGEIGTISGVGIALALCAVKIVQAMTVQHYFFVALRSQQQVVNGINLRIYQRSLRLTRLERQRRPVGDIVNYLGTDTNAISMFMWSSIELCYSVVLIMTVFTALVWCLGSAAFAGMGVLVTLSPLARILAKRFVKLDDKLMMQRDKRVSMISQIITGIRIVKFFTWEKLIQNEVSAQRELELRSRKKLAIAEGFSVLLYLSSSTLACIAAFSCYLYLGNILSPGTVFSAIALFMVLEQPFGNMTEFISNIAGAKVSALRILEFIGKDGLAGAEGKISAPSQPVGVELTKFSARYEDAETNVLSNITLRVAPGQSLAVVGSVGAGKTSLLLALLGEIPQFSGNINFTNILPGETPNTGWVPQEPFIRSATLRENIVFGSEETGVEAAIFATTFDEDLKLFPAGLSTEIGEQGVNLSGGQKQRVSLARAILAKPGIVYLDDPLAAVDSDTETAIIERLIFGAWQGITRIMVTHRLEYLRRFDQVAFLDRGEIICIDSFENLLANNELFSAFYREHEKSNQHGKKVTEAAKITAEISVNDADLELDFDTAESHGKFVRKEDRETGSVGAQVYFQYLKALAGPAGWRRVAMLTFLFGTSIAAAGIPIIQNLWLSIWTNRQPGDSFLTKWMYGFIRADSHNVKIYGFLGVMTLTVFVVKTMVWALRSVAAGRTLHDNAFNAVLHAPVRFFDTTPVGRVLNRFSQDVDAVERELPWAFNHMIGAFLSTVGSLTVLIIALPPILLLMGPIFWLYYRLQYDFRASGREIKRLFSISRSPRFAHFKETLEGLTVIRGMHRQKLFLDGFYKTLANNARVYYGMVSLNRWFSIRVPLLGGVISSAVAIGLIYAAKLGMLQAGTAGMVLIYSLGLWEGLNWCIRSFSEAEARMISVERLKSYGDIIPERSTKLLAVAADLSGWPARGEIVFEDVVAGYAAHLPDVLKGVSFVIPGGKKVGFIGRTGAGKSTIFQLLFRFMDVRSGRILIDGHDIATIDLAVLRRNIAIIPQDPTLFMGSLRSNLDRFQQFSDEKIWRALERVEIAGYFRELDKGLETEVHEQGHNFSQGQRQLLCLARALLVEAKIIVMDEVTASVDVATDAIIQEAIRRECKDQTVLIIAHRLGTVAECDFLIELANGEVVSQHTPSNPSIIQQVGPLVD